MGRIPQERINSAMTLNIVAGCGGQMFIAVASPQPIFNVFFMNHLGASSTQLGVLVGIAQLAALFQLLSILIYARIPRRKSIFIPFHLLHRLFGLVLAAVAFSAAAHGPVDANIKVVFLAFGASWILMNMSAAGWWSWVADLFPDKVRATFFGRRSAVINAVYVVWFFGVTLALDLFSSDNIFIVYGVIFLIASAVGLADILIHITIPEPKRTVAPIDWATFVEPLRNGNFVGFSVAIGVAIFSINVFAPFSAPFITSQDISAPNTWLGIMFVMSQMVWVGVVGPWGVIMDRFGRKPVVILGTLSCLSWIGYFFLTQTNYVYILPVIAITGGLLAPGFWEGVNQMMLTLTPSKNRVAYVAWYTAIVGVVSAGGSYLGGRVDDLLRGVRIPLWGAMQLHSIHIVLAGSLALVGVSIFVLTRIREGKDKPVSYVVERIARPGIFRTFFNIGVIGRTTPSLKVARALRTIDGSESDIAIEEIVSRLDDPDTEVREEAARALGRIGSPLAVDVLIERLRDESSSIRPEAARALGRIRDPRALPALLEGLGSASEDVEEACIEALGAIGGTDSIQALQRLLKDAGSDRLFTTSAEAVSRLGLIEAAWEIIDRMHRTENPVLRRQLAIASANLLGRPGEFYRYLTGSSAQKQAHIDRLFQHAASEASELLEERNRDADELRRQLRAIRRMLTHEQYEMAFGLLLKCAELLVTALTGAGDSEALAKAAFDYDQRLGLWWWFLQSATTSAEQTKPEHLAIDVLIGVYFLAAWRPVQSHD